MSARRTTMLLFRPLCARCVCEWSSSVTFCSLWGPPGALDSEVYWPAHFCCVWPQNLEPTISTYLRWPELTLSAFKRQLKTHLFQH